MGRVEEHVVDAGDNQFMEFMKSYEASFNMTEVAVSQGSWSPGQSMVKYEQGSYHCADPPLCSVFTLAALYLGLPATTSRRL
jgi:hypothetical protein